MPDEERSALPAQRTCKGNKRVKNLASFVMYLFGFAGILPCDFSLIPKKLLGSLFPGF